MIERYTYPEMKQLWEAENRYKKWLEIEILACEGWASIGRVPAEAVEAIREKARFDIARIREIEAIVDHDVIAFLTNVSENVGSEARYIHMGMTSYDVVDTALSLILRDAADIIIRDIRKVIDVLVEKAREYKNTPMIGRTHGVHAEPITFGLKLAVWVAEMRRNLARVQRAREVVSVGRISGAVGTYASMDPRVEEYVCSKLGLEPARASTQVLSRDRHAEYVTTLAIIAGSLEKFATEIRGLQRTEVFEVQEPFRPGQKGSSAMPHKRNPIVSERLCGLARVMRGCALAAMENMPLWHERDISNSSVERLVLPDATTLIDYMLRRFAEVMEGLVVRKDRMQANLAMTGGLIFSEAIMLALVGRGLSREHAYALVQRSAARAWDEGLNFRDLISGDPEITAVLKPADIEACFDLARHLAHVDDIFRRVGI
ncbi:MAG: adenylosuccinate lyase [Bacillota bacterium]|nr:adenylosuccinate lyase [Bacillota bacterium]